MRIIVLSIMIVTLTVNSCFAQTGRERIEVKHTDIKQSGVNFEIKSERPLTDSIFHPAARGVSTCYVQLANYTSYAIDIYVDGYWEGTVGAYDDYYLSYPIYGEAQVCALSIDKTKEWEIKGITCYSSYGGYNGCIYFY